MKGQPSAVPLEGVRVEASIQDFCTRVTMTQRYRNRESHPIEAVYVFPLDETAAVSGFAAMIDGVEVVGEVKDRDEAFDEYDDALAEGHGAYLLDQEKPDVFTASIGNLPPGKEVFVNLTYVTELTREGDDLRFVLPTTVSPRYAPPEERKGVGKPPAEAVSPPTEWTVPYGLHLTVSIDMGSAIRSVESPSHPIAIEMDGARAMVRLGRRETTMDRDFVLLVCLAEPQKPRAWIEQTEDGESVAMLAFEPKLETQSAPSELVFLVDRSGSMMGTSFEEARNALQLCLRSLTEQTWFNIVGFGSSHQTLFPESVPYGENTLADASSYVESLQADLGGTEILPVLESVLSAPARPGFPRQLFILTDGEVTNTEAVIAMVRKHSDTTRVFTFGIGAGASHHLVRGMARAGEGAAEFIYPGERIESKVLRQLKRALAPALTGIQVDWGGLHVKQAPYRVPPAFADGRLLVYGFLEEAPRSRETEIKLRARSPAGGVSFSVPLILENKRSGNLIATLAARTLLRDLEEGASEFHERGSRQERPGKDRVKEEAVRLGVRYGLTSRWTSFVAVEKRETPVEGRMELRRIPVALTRGWGGLDFPRPVSVEMAAVTEISRAWADRVVSFAEPPAYRQGKDAFAPTRATPKCIPVRPLDMLVVLQRADGSWNLNPALAHAVKKTLAELEQSLPDFTGDRGQARRAWATSLAIHWLETHASEWRDEWELIHAKATGWLARCKAQPKSGEDWLAAASRFFD